MKLGCTLGNFNKKTVVTWNLIILAHVARALRNLLQIVATKRNLLQNVATKRNLRLPRACFEKLALENVATKKLVKGESTWNISVETRNFDVLFTPLMCK